LMYVGVGLTVTGLGVNIEVSLPIPQRNVPFSPSPYVSVPSHLSRPITSHTGVSSLILSEPIRECPISSVMSHYITSCMRVSSVPSYPIPRVSHPIYPISSHHILYGSVDCPIYPSPYTGVLSHLPHSISSHPLRKCRVSHLIPSHEFPITSIPFNSITCMEVSSVPSHPIPYVTVPSHLLRPITSHLACECGVSQLIPSHT